MKGIQKQIRKALEAVDATISAHGRSYSGKGINYAGGLASEGYSGGYRDALVDVEMALRGIYNNNSQYWPKPMEVIKDA